MSAGTDRSRRVLLVEVQAHETTGHYPVAFAELARQIAALGIEVAALTRCGWTLDGDPAFPPLTIHRFDRASELAYTWGARLSRLGPRSWGTRLAALAKTAVVARSARTVAHRDGFTDVVLVSAVDAPLASLYARRCRWISNQFYPPGNHRTDRLVRRISERWTERHRVRLRIATSAASNNDAWRRAAPWLAPTVIPFIAVPPRVAVPAARASLGLPETGRVALMFGVHPRKDPEAVWAAFTRLPDWRLVVAGGHAATEYRSWARRARPDGPPPILVDGYVDEETRARIHSAADLMVLSFVPGLDADSGNLVDAIAWGIPVVCSDGVPAAELVRRFRLGSVFAAGDETALREAVRSAPTTPDPDGLAAARDELSAGRITQQYLDALAELDREPVRTDPTTTSPP